MNRPKNNPFIAVVSLLVASACVATLPIPLSAPESALPTPDMGLTGLAQTLTAAPTATFTLTLTSSPMATATFTPTLFPTITPLPTETPIPSDTPTPSVSDTPTGLPEVSSMQTQAATTPEVESNPTGSEYACQFIKKSPETWAIFKPRANFDAVWQLRNNGTRSWQTRMVKIVLVEGPRLGQDRTIELRDDVKAGEILRIGLNMEAPREDGAYVAIWGLRNMRNNTLFCIFRLRFIVKRQ